MACLNRYTVFFQNYFSLQFDCDAALVKGTAYAASAVMQVTAQAAGL